MRLATLICALVLGACVSMRPGPPDPAGFAAGVRSGELDAARFDFARARFWELDQEQRRAWREVANTALTPGDTRNRGCAADDLLGAQSQSWVFIAQMAADADAWRRDHETLRAFGAELEARIAAQVEGDDGGDSAIALFQRDRRASADARIRELFARVIRDQTVMFVMMDVNRAGLPEREAAMRIDYTQARLARILCDNTEWLRTQMAEIGWFDANRFGARADGAAWLIAQHSDRSAGFQAEALAVLEALPAGATSPRNLAYLWDRVAVAEGRLQRYGTQLTCVAGRHQPNVGLEDGVDERRAAAGLMPLAEYVAQMGEFAPCPPAL